MLYSNTISSRGNREDMPSRDSRVGPILRGAAMRNLSNDPADRSRYQENERWGYNTRSLLDQEYNRLSFGKYSSRP